MINDVDDCVHGTAPSWTLGGALVLVGIVNRRPERGAVHLPREVNDSTEREGPDVAWQLSD
jgi:hypothetical protein